MKPRTPTYLLILLLALAASRFLCFPGHAEPLTLSTAVARALERSPALSAFDAEIRIAEARTISALALPNPELETEVEDALGDGVFDGFDSAVYNAGISQLVETGHKRRLRGDVAEAESELTRLQFEVAKRRLVAEVASRYVEVLAAQRVEEIARENLNIANEAYESVHAQVEGGRGSAIDSGQALIGRNEAQLASESANLRSQLARQKLSSLWAEAEPSFDRVAGGLESPARGIPSRESLDATIPGHPAVALARSGVDAATAQLELERKKRVPDVTVGVGYRHDRTVEDNAVVLGLSLPLPLFNRNEGGIAEAEAVIEKNEALVSQTETQLRLEIASARARMEAARAAHDLVVGKMLPAAEKHYGSLSEGLRLGRTPYLELLEARRALNSVRLQQVEALADYHSARAELEAITGR